MALVPRSPAAIAAAPPVASRLELLVPPCLPRRRWVLWRLSGRWRREWRPAARLFPLSCSGSIRCAGVPAIGREATTLDDAAFGADGDAGECRLRVQPA